jgi:hypothetical protein
LHGAVFADAGDAWIDRFDVRRSKLSAGAELSANIVAGYAITLTVAFGAAWGRDGAGAVDGGAIYVRLGRAF